MGVTITCWFCAAPVTLIDEFRNDCPACGAVSRWFKDPQCGNGMRIWSKTATPQVTYTCSGCQQEVHQSDITVPSEPTKKRRSKEEKWAIAIVVVIVLCVVGVFLPGSKDNTGAIQYCEKQVKQQLISPSTASFTSVTAHGSGDNLSIDGYVDADNAFGAPLHKHWNCDSSGLVTIDG